MSIFVLSVCLIQYVDGGEIEFSDENKNYLFSERFCDAEYEFVYCGLGTAEDTENIDVNGKIALIDRGAHFDETVPNLTEKGAVGVIIINNKDGIQLGVDSEAFEEMPFVL